MAESFAFYGKFFAALANKEIDFNSDSIKLALVTSSYVPNRDTHDYFDDITNEVSGTGYAAGGSVVGSAAFSYVAANSWAAARVASTAYTLGQVRRPDTGNGYLYQVITAGTTGSGTPTYPTTIGGTVADGTVVWLCVAKGGLVLTGNGVSWTSSTITNARGGVLYDSSPGSAATRPLIGYLDFVTDRSTVADTFQVAWGSIGIGAVLVP